MKTGEKIMERRQKMGHSLDELGALAGVNGMTVDRWEAGLEAPDEKQLKSLAEIFGCSYEKLLPDPEKQPEWGLCWTSRRRLFGLPLVDIDISFKGKAEGIIAVGFMAKGVVSVGVLSMGVVSAGLLSVGLASAGLISMGIFSAHGIGLSLFHIALPWIETAWGFLTAGSRINPYG